MLFKRVWLKVKRWPEPDYLYTGWFLFGIIPLVVQRETITKRY